MAKKKDAEPKKPAKSNREINKEDAVSYARDFYGVSWQWRSQAFHTLWDKLQNNYLSKYPLDIKAKKKPWSSCLFIPETFKTVEIICAAITKILFGRKRPISIAPRERGDELQAELNTDLLDYEVDKSGFAVAFYDTLKEALIYGSGFMKFYWMEKKDKRRLKTVDERFGFMDEARGACGMGPRVKAGDVKSLKEEVQEVYVKQNVVCERVHIRDIFLEPNSTDLQRVLHRTKITWGELLDMAKAGFFDKDTVDTLKDVIESNQFEQSLSITHVDGRDWSAKAVSPDSASATAQQGITFPTPVRPKFDRQHSVWELWAPLPRRFIELDLDPEADTSNEIVPGKLMIASGSFYLGAEENPNQSMSPPFLQLNYIRVGQTYGLGAAQIMMDLQEDLNETSNQRIDNVALIMNKMLAVIERGIVNPDDLVSQPGGTVRLKMPNSGADPDVSKIIMPLEFPDITRSAYLETQERERQIQEATAATRLTAGTTGPDQGQTLGGMELQRQGSSDRFANYAYVMGKTFIVPAGQKFHELIYQHYTPERVQRVLGEQPVEFMPGDIRARWELLKIVEPHELCQDYDFEFTDVFSEENKMARKNALAADMQLTAGLLPQFNPYPGLKKIYAFDGFESDEITDILGPEQPMIDTPLAQGLGQPSQPKLTKAATEDAPSPSSPPPGSPMANPGF